MWLSLALLVGACNRDNKAGGEAEGTSETVDATGDGPGLAEVRAAGRVHFPSAAWVALSTRTAATGCASRWLLRDHHGLSLGRRLGDELVVRIDELAGARPEHVVGVSRAWVYYGTDLRAEEIRSNKARKERLKLAKTVAGHDRLIGWAWPLFGSDPEDAETLRDISRGTGRRDDAEDVLRLVDLYRAAGRLRARSRARIG